MLIDFFADPTELKVLRTKSTKVVFLTIFIYPFLSYHFTCRYHSLKPTAIRELAVRAEIRAFGWIKPAFAGISLKLTGIPEPLDLILEARNSFKVSVSLQGKLWLNFFNLEYVQVILAHHLLVDFLVLGDFLSPVLDLFIFLKSKSLLKFLLLPFQSLIFLCEHFLGMLRLFDPAESILQFKVHFLIHFEFIFKSFDLFLLLLCLGLHWHFHGLNLLRDSFVFWWLFRLLVLVIFLCFVFQLVCQNQNTSFWLFKLLLCLFFLSLCVLDLVI